MKDITIFFTGHNIKDYISLSINSLLYFHPEYKKNIVYVDDNSNDNTIDILKSNNIKIIEWKPSEYLHETIDMSYRVSCIYKEIFEQCKTRYLMINDGDIVFYDKIKYNYSELIQEYPLLFDILPVVDGSYKRNCKYNKYLYKNNTYYRAYPCHMIFDMEYLRKNNIYEFDDITEDWKIDSIFLDLGADFLYKVFHNKLKYMRIRFEFEYIYHFGFTSCLKRLEENDTQLTNHIQLLLSKDRFLSFYDENIKFKYIMNLYGKNVINNLTRSNLC